MKKFIGIFLLLCLIIPFTGTVSWLNYQKKKVRKQIKHNIIAGIDKDELVQLTFTIEETITKLNWKHSKEFEYNTQMYDIVEADTLGNTVIYLCWWDHQETKLNKELNKLLGIFLGNDNQNKETKTRFANFYKSLFNGKSDPWKVMITEKDNPQFTPYIFNYTSLYFPPHIQPPNYS